METIFSLVIMAVGAALAHHHRAALQRVTG